MVHNPASVPSPLSVQSQHVFVMVAPLLLAGSMRRQSQRHSMRSSMGMGARAGEGQPIFQVGVLL